MALVQELQNIGLSEKEAKVYLAALELGQSSVQKIAQKAKVNRATTYSVLESLIKKGLCSTFERGKKTFYIASTPDSLLSLFEVRKKDIEEKEKYFKNLLPDLRSIYNIQEAKPIVKFFEGKQGLLHSIDEFYGPMKKEERVRMAYNKDRLDKLFKKEEKEKYRKVRLGKKVKSKVIYNKQKGVLPSTPDGIRTKVDEKKYPITCDIGIYGDAVRIAPLIEKLSSVLIRDKEIAKTMKSIFDLAFEAAEMKKRQDKREK